MHEKTFRFDIQSLSSISNFSNFSHFNFTYQNIPLSVVIGVDIFIISGYVISNLILEG